MARTGVSLDVRDTKHGRVRVDVYDRITADDIMVHMIRREVYRLAGGKDPGDGIAPDFRDFVIYSGTIPGS